MGWLVHTGGGWDNGGGAEMWAVRRVRWERETCVLSFFLQGDCLLGLRANAARFIVGLGDGSVRFGSFGTRRNTLLLLLCILSAVLRDDCYIEGELASSH